MVIFIIFYLGQEHVFSADLHSNMVIFIINYKKYWWQMAAVFTFQYGYIYYFKADVYKAEYFIIYIPIWLYLLL